MDPPRSGLDDTTRALAKKFPKILSIYLATLKLYIETYKSF